MIDYAQFRLVTGIFNFHYIQSKMKKSKYKNQMPKNIFFIFILIFLTTTAILGTQICQNHSSSLQSKSNKMAHITFGNRNISHKKGSFKLLHWNKGNSKLGNKYDDICMTIQNFKPQFFSIQEANYNIYSNLKFPGYKIEYNKLPKIMIQPVPYFW